MPVIRIQDLARIMIDELAPQYGYRAEDIKIGKSSGRRPAKNFCEELMSHEETRRTMELDLLFLRFAGL
ncbi:MAG: hypothetical protein R2874_12275 [Desulfobacterales bacterium]